jgi:hypothetical protein
MGRQEESKGIYIRNVDVHLDEANTSYQRKYLQCSYTITMYE